MLCEELLLNTLEDLDQEKFLKFKMFLTIKLRAQQRPLTRFAVDGASRLSMVQHMYDSYGGHEAVELATTILTRMNLNNQARLLKEHFDEHRKEDSSASSSSFSPSSSHSSSSSFSPSSPHSSSSSFSPSSSHSSSSSSAALTASAVAAPRPTESAVYVPNVTPTIGTWNIDLANNIYIGSGKVTSGSILSGTIKAGSNIYIGSGDIGSASSGSKTVQVGNIHISD